MSSLEEHDAEQAAITALCEAGLCDHPECHEDDEAVAPRDTLRHLNADDLTEQLLRFSDAHDIEYASADEMLLAASSQPPLERSAEDEQRIAWLVDYVEAWDRLQSAPEDGSDPFPLPDPNSAPVAPSKALVRPIWDLSTAHITEATAKWLETNASQTGEHGYLVYVREEVQPGTIPPDLAYLMKCALGHVDYILFDGDAMIDPRLPSWEW